MDDKSTEMYTETVEDHSKVESNPIYMISTSDTDNPRFFKAPNDSNAVFSFISLLSQSQKEEVQPVSLVKIVNLSPQEEILLCIADDVKDIASLIERSDKQLLVKVNKAISKVLEK